MFLLDFNSLIGIVRSADIKHSLWLMLQGMVGIFLVMFIIYLVIVILSKASSKRMDNNDNEQKGE